MGHAKAQHMALWYSTTLLALSELLLACLPLGPAPEATLDAQTDGEASWGRRPAPQLLWHCLALCDRNNTEHGFTGPVVAQSHALRSLAWHTLGHRALAHLYAQRAAHGPLPPSRAHSHGGMEARLPASIRCRLALLASEEGEWAQAFRWLGAAQDGATRLCGLLLLVEWYLLQGTPALAHQCLQRHPLPHAPEYELACIRVLAAQGHVASALERRARLHALRAQQTSTWAWRTEMEEARVVAHVYGEAQQPLRALDAVLDWLAQSAKHNAQRAAREAELLLADIHLQRGQATAARHLLDTLRPALLAHATKSMQARSALLYGHALQATGAPGAMVRAAWEEAWTGYERVGGRLGARDAALALALWAHQEGDDAARTRWATCYQSRQWSPAWESQTATIGRAWEETLLFSEATFSAAPSSPLVSPPSCLSSSSLSSLSPRLDDATALLSR